jgi:hypothetical protein
MEKLVDQEDKLWQEVFRLIERNNGQAYDQAVAHLLDLRNLARYLKREPFFQDRVSRICEEYPTRSGLLRRLRSAGLVETE